MPTVYLVSRLPDQARTGLVIDLGATDTDGSGSREGPSSLSLASTYREHGNQWLREFSDDLGALNTENAGLGWWAHTSTAKNLLSSPLGNRLFQARAALKVVHEDTFDHLYIVGATKGQRAIIRAGIRGYDRKVTLIESGDKAEFTSIETTLRLCWQAVRLIYALIRWRGRFDLPATPTMALTYVDAGVSEKSDAFFGRLHDLFQSRTPPADLNYLAFVQAPYQQVLPRLLEFDRQLYSPVFLHAGIRDLAGALLHSLRELAFPAFKGQLRSVMGSASLLGEAFRWDLAKGGYFHNLLLYRTLRRFLRKRPLQRLIYPYENKSLEKMLLLAVRAECPGCRIIGYQHTSITPRHTTFRLSGSEMAVTPLPDRIITAGEITRRHLEQQGGYPTDLLRAGCALRQSSLSPDDHAPRVSGRVLLALSSSRFELVAATEFMMRAVAARNDLQIGIRPHPEFPLSLLPDHLRKWVHDQANDLSGTPLQENLHWCSTTAYVSSTVALECLMLGKPVINLDLGEIVIPDPVLNPPPLWQRVADPLAFAAALDAADAVPAETRLSHVRQTREYMRAYFSPVTPAAIDQFLQ